MKSFCTLLFIQRTIVGFLVCNWCLVPFYPNVIASESTEQQILDVFPPSAAASDRQGQGNTSISLEYTPSKSLWAEDWMRGSLHAQIQHDQAESNSTRCVSEKVDRSILFVGRLAKACHHRVPVRDRVVHLGTTRSGSLSQYAASTTD